MAGSKDPLDDIGNLVEQTLNILNTSGLTDAETYKTPYDAAPGVLLNQAKADHNHDRLTENDTMKSLSLNDSVSLRSDEALAVATSLLQTTAPAPLDEEVDILGHGPSPGRYKPSPSAKLGAAVSLNAAFEEQPLGEEPLSVVQSPAVEQPAAKTDKSTPEISAEPSLAASDDIGNQHADCPVHVWIKDPEKIETTNTLGIKTHYYTYVVRTDSTLPGFTATGMECRRRFSEFDTLHKLLHTEYRGYFIPPLPQKSFIEGKIASEDFLRLRRADLQAFLRAVAAHPVLRESEILKVFLLQPGELSRNPAWVNLLNPPQTAKPRAGQFSTYSMAPSYDMDSPRLIAASASSESVIHASPSHAPASQPAAVGGNLASAAKANLGNWMSWMKQSVQFVPPKRELPLDEVHLRQAKELLQDLKRLLELATESARTLCQDMDKLCSDYYELGRNMGMLSRYEEAVQSKVGQYTPEGHSAANRSSDFQKVSMCLAKQHGAWKTMSLKSAANLVTLHDQYILVPEAIRALEEREQALETLYQLTDDLASKQHQLEQLQGGPGKLLGAMVSVMSSANNSEKKSQQLTYAIGHLEEQIKAAREQYHLVKQRNQSELSRLGLEREADFKKMLSAFAVTQAQLAQTSADLWASLARQYAGKE
mmetsp:Transcript_38886/g.86490  ORF Transcript_38886/g.86490 Transcript_38886/m.86490 type:complete len:651 (-) Transcript_38886:1015-2967(-)|eukprot:CAMPEP_0202902026 /NCGR_PEP_ID=MMETSP1392-20130828/15931_1 /ASSEMBLY_ACC=CAM_ASM_000868 /TAXON_ID=225041 /ORGANISM="Chlamydomonas chlamydogama, Strain SAG 11-48b" /LENGTH=650 /DNA_ID=CAMNT_0049588705 /DNA_START=138 /DNA_END=2090 /DNA_ORIENTATION=-